MSNVKLMLLSLLCGLALSACATTSKPLVVRECNLPPLPTALAQPPSYMKQVSDVLYQSGASATALSPASKHKPLPTVGSKQ